MVSNDSTVLDEGEYKKFLEEAITGKYYKDSYFAELQLDVIKEKETLVLSKEDEEKVFHTVRRFLKHPKPGHFIGIFTLQKLAFMPPSTPIERLEDIAKVICDEVFNYTSHRNIGRDWDIDCDIDEDEPVVIYTDFCKGFAFLKATKSDSEQTITFEEVLINSFLEKLRFRFSFEQRLQDLVQNYKGPEEKKQNWILQRGAEYNRSKREADSRSIDFLKEMYTLYPEIVFRAVELLLSMNEQRATHYLWSLLDNLKGKNLENEYWLSRRLTNISAMKKDYLESERRKESVVQLKYFTFYSEKKNLTQVIANINYLSEQSDTITLDVKNLLHHITEDCCLKDNIPQDYIKYCIKDSLKSHPLKTLEITSIDHNSDCIRGNLYHGLLISKMYPSRSSGMYLRGGKEWFGFRIKV